MYSYFLLCIVCTLFGAFGGFYFKKSASGSESIIKILFNLNLYIGGICYCIGAILNIIILKHLPYTIVMPITSITYIWTIIISYFLLKEKITIKKMLGISLIILGALMLGLIS
jgi:drug/metabolite transporter (DMT)-like permease